MFWLTEVFCVIAGIEADNHVIYWNLLPHVITRFSKLIMYFTINLALINYLNMLPNLTDSLPLIKDRTRYEQPLPLNLSVSNFDSSPRHAPTKLKDFMIDYIKDKEIFELKQRHAVVSLNKSSKNFFSNYIIDIIMFASSIISIISITLVVYLFCKYKHIRMLVASLILHKIKEVEVNSNSEETNYECRTLAYIGILLTVLSLIIVTFLHYR